MNEEIDDKVDRFHKAIISRFTKNALAAVAIFIILFASWYVAATYKEYDEWRFEGTWAIVRRAIIIDDQLRELNVSFGQFLPILPLSNGLNTTTMIYCDNSTRNGHRVYWEVACLADAQFQSLYHVKEFLGHVEYGRPIDHEMTMHYYYTLIHNIIEPQLEFSFRSQAEPEKLMAYEEFHIDYLYLLQEIAHNRLAEVYRVLMSQKTIFVQGREYTAQFRGDGYFGENEYPCLEGDCP